MLKLKNHSTDPAFNLAFEEYFTKKSAEIGDSLIFFWRNRPAVIIGRFQNTFEELDPATARELDIEVYRRNTGGGAVYHDLNNLNYSFILPAGSSDYLRDVKNAAPFDLLFEIILELLGSLGVQAEKSGRNDLLLGGRKVSGAARQLTRQGLLLHGTLLFDVDLESLGRVLTASPDKYASKGLKSVRSRVCNLKEVLPADMSITDFQAALEKALDAPEYQPSVQDLEAIKDLAQSKYRQWNWNWGSSPASTMRKKERFPWGSLELYLELEGGCIKNASIYGDFFSNQSLSSTSDDLVESMARGLCGLRHQSTEVKTLLESYPLEEMFIGAKAAEVIIFFLE